MFKIVSNPWKSAKIRRSALFDGKWYKQTYQDVECSGMDPAHHYGRFGAAEGRDPGPEFSTTGYRNFYNIKTQNPLLHYEKTGRSLGYLPCPVFSGSLPPQPEKTPVVFVAHLAKSHVFGAERSLLTILDKAIEANILPTLIVPHIYPGPYLDDLLARCCTLHPLPYGWRRARQSPHEQTVTQFIKIFTKSKAVALYQNTLVLDAPIQAAQQINLPTIMHVHELPDSDPDLCALMDVTAQDLRKTLCQGTTDFVVASPAIADWLNVPPSRVTVAPNEIDPQLFDLPAFLRSPPRIAMVSSNIAKKGIKDFVKVARIFAAKGGVAKFLLIGPMSDDLAQLFPLPDNVRHTGYATSPVAAIRQADLVLSLSNLAESFGLTVYEAMAAGRPVICYNRGMPPDLINTSGAGIVTAVDDCEAVAEAILDILISKEKFLQYSHAARAQGHFLRSQTAAQISRVFHNISPSRINGS
jgi:glycosyltransferase involved in cell wall biosynthesis